MQIKNLKSERGFSFVELILVIVVTGILGSTLVIPFTQGIKEATVPEIYSTATFLAQKRIEEYRSNGYTTTSDSLDPDPDGEEVTVGVRTYTETVYTGYVTHPGNSFSSLVSSPSSEFIMVKVKVSNTNMPNDIELWTILTKDFYDPDPS